MIMKSARTKVALSFLANILVFSVLVDIFVAVVLKRTTGLQLLAAPVLPFVFIVLFLTSQIQGVQFAIHIPVVLVPITAVAAALRRPNRKVLTLWAHGALVAYWLWKMPSSRMPLVWTSPAG